MHPGVFVDVADRAVPSSVTMELAHGGQKSVLGVEYTWDRDRQVEPSDHREGESVVVLRLVGMFDRNVGLDVCQ